MKNPLIPMGAITGQPTRAELIRMMRSHREAGIEQFLIYPRSGLLVGYMSDEWLDICQIIVEEAEALGMDIWLYDEYNWPSGSCKGRVMAFNPEFSAKQLDIWSEEGVWRAQRRMYGGAMPDLLDEACVDLFIQLTHQRYFDRLHAHFGRVIKGFFTDEPSFAYGLRNAPPSPAGEAHAHLPYYDQMPAEYRARTGRDLLTDVLGAAAGTEAERVGADYYALLGDRFRRTYMDRIARWCDAHGVHASGHLMEESRPTGAAAYNGDAARVLDGLTLPGIDEIHTAVTLERAEWHTLKLAERSIRARNSGGLAELFALGPCDMPMAKLRQMIWLCALHGIDHYVLAVSALDAQGNLEKDQYYNPMNHTAPWFRHVRLLGEDARLAAEIARRTPVAALYVRLPQAMAATKRFEAIVRGAREGDAAALDRRYLELLRALVARQHDWALLAEGEGAPAGAPVLRLDGGLRVREEVSGQCFARVEDAIAHLEGLVPRCPRIYEGEALAKDLLVTRFVDGSWAMLDLSDAPGERTLTVREASGARTVRLYARGIHLSDRATDAPSAPRAAQILPVRAMRLTLTARNLMRLPFPQGAGTSFAFEVKEELADVRLLLRAAHGEAGAIALTLDGVPVPADRPCEDLTPGFRALYRASAPFALRKGWHRAELTAGADSRYFPVALLAGAFALREDVLAPLPTHVDCGDLRKMGLRDYVGEVELRFAAQMPAAGALSLDAGAHAVELCVDGASLGVRPWAPCIWALPAHAAGRRVEICVRITTGIGGMFGNLSRDFLIKGGWTSDPALLPGRFGALGLLRAPEWLPEEGAAQ